ncbi:type I-E CRISPR-associated protein Cse1/CasA [Streptomyces sp. CBMA156]|uniref:type I-E CRISPR-associated protein Cse1/CasA n=1 Tax=Streptomyces sp. CBMA156 TaxID=1930280 RepID=UPI001661E610|nr:type I-E CRISPR-associated protein Cse1/CasA [Streptomyces sp. CBMA156]MBD0670757.1 type I-E CRISPR-associated protein Cse1/CasA [Streptomyces sp. CBMA156]
MTSAPPAYNLFDEAWIPVRWVPHGETNDEAESTARPSAVGLRELLLRAHEIEQIEIANPPALSALYRVLYTITARVTGLDEAGPGDWSGRRLDLVAVGSFGEEQVATYVAPVHGRFGLFDPVRPFLQDPRLSEQCDPANTAGVDKLVTTRPSGNNHSWFVHVNSTAPELPTPAQAVLHLLVWHYYGPSGRCSSRTVGDIKDAGSKAGPLRSTLSYHPEGETLFESLLAGLPEPGRDIRREADLCPWEWEVLPDPVAAPPSLKGPCSALTARSQHALLLVPDATGAFVEDAFITWAYREKISREGDPYLIWQTSKEGNSYPRPADSHRALWRDLDALLLKDPAGSARPRRPEVFRTALDVSDELRVRALGFEQDGQAKDTQFVDAVTPPVLGLAEDREPTVAVEIGRLRVLGERYGSRLDRAAKKAWAAFTEAPKIRDCTWAVDAAARYWPAAEAEFWKRLGARDFDGAAVGFRILAEQAYDTVTHGALGTMRGSKACTKARIELYGGPVKAPARTGGTGGRTTSTEDT